MRFVMQMLSLSWMVAVSMVYAQDYPNKPIRIVTGAAGGSGDFEARIIAQGIAPSLGQPVIIDNRAASFLSADVAAKAAPDGYTLTVQSNTLWTIPLMRKTPYDAVQDFAPITTTTRAINVLIVHPSLPVKSVKELIALAKARPAELNYGSGATGATAHLSMELFKSMAGVNITRVTYKSGGQAVPAVIANEVQMTISDASVVGSHIKAGRARGLAITSPTPSALMPGMPTISASGLPGYEAISMSGVLAPSKTPGAIIARLNQEVVRLFSKPEVRETFLNAGSEVAVSTPTEFAAKIKTDIVRIGKVIKEAGIQPE